MAFKLTLSDLPVDFDQPPNVTQFFRRIFVSLDELCFKPNKPADVEFVKSMIASIKLADILIVLVIGTVFTLLRVAFTKRLSMPLARVLLVSQKHMSKWPESTWKFSVYTCLWLLSLYIVVLSGKYDFLQNSLHIFKGMVFGDAQLQEPVPTDIYWMYVVQLGFYMHSIIGTLFMDVWRKDSVMMLLHHALTIFLIEFSFLVRYYRIGALVLLLHDLSDIILEFTKLQIYMRDRANRYWPVHEWIANVGFILFTLSWAWLRLYWYPLKVLYSSTWGVYIHHRHNDHKLVLFFNVMLLALQALHIYWFYFILLLLFRVATGQQREVDDTREFDVEPAVNNQSGDSAGRLRKQKRSD